MSSLILIQVNNERGVLSIIGALDHNDWTAGLYILRYNIITVGGQVREIQCPMRLHFDDGKHSLTDELIQDGIQFFRASQSAGAVFLNFIFGKCTTIILVKTVF